MPEASAQGQEAPGDHVYRFALEGVHDPASAKTVQYALLEHPFVRMCTYVQECQCFKLASSIPLDRSMLEALALATGHALEGTVHGSDGTLLPGAEPLDPER